MSEIYQTKLRSRERGYTLGRGIEVEEAFLLPLLTEIEQDGDSDEVYLMLYNLFSTYCRYEASEKMSATLVRMDALEVRPGNDCSALVAQNLFKSGLLPERIAGYIRRGYGCIEQMPHSKQRHWELYLLKTLELAVLSEVAPRSERVGTLLTELALLRKGVRQYTRYLLCALQNLVAAGMTPPETRILAKGMRSSMTYLTSTGHLNAEAGVEKLAAINGLLVELNSRSIALTSVASAVATCDPGQ